jgi:Type II secretion system protein B
LSSILRALKKLENEPRHLEENQPLDSKYVTLADTEPQRKYPGIFMMVLGGGIVCGLVILAGWWLLSEKPQPPPAVTEQAFRTSSKLVESRTPALDINKAQVQTALEKPAKPLMAQPETPEKIEQVREPEPAGLEKPAFRTIKEDISSVEVQTPDKTVPTQITPSLKTGGQISKPDEKPAVASVSTPVTPPKTVALEIPRLKDPDMKLQAVTWSRAPQKRIAVINNRILREGEMVSGYLISKINQDDVVLSLDGEKWKLLFR